MSSFVRFTSIPLLFLTLLSPLAAQNAAPPTTDNSVVADLESKLATALRSYSLLDAELDRLKAANAQLAAEKSALEAKLTETQAALPLAAQAVTLREKLRQTQAQMEAYAEENVQLKTKLALTSPDVRTGHASPAPAPASVAPVTSAPVTPSPRTHVIVEGDTLVKISQTYYGTANRWSDILAANRDVLRDEKSLVIGRSLILP